MSDFFLNSFAAPILNIDLDSLEFILYLLFN